MTPKILAETLSSMIEEVTPAQLKIMPRQDVIALGMLQNMLNIQMLQVEILDDIAKKLNPNKEVIDRFSHPHVAMSLARIEAHYFVNNIFLYLCNVVNVR